MNTILLVEDSEADILLLRRAVSRSTHNLHVETVSDGEAALAYLRKEGAYTESPTPSLVLLDINLPGRSGRDILEEIKSDPHLKRVPVVVLTSSGLPSDVNGMYERYASSYFVKPANPSSFDAMLNKFADYWFDQATLPSPLGTP